MTEIRMTQTKPSGVRAELFAISAQPKRRRERKGGLAEGQEALKRSRRAYGAECGNKPADV
jgi:hypothetical protein